MSFDVENPVISSPVGTVSIWLTDTAPTNHLLIRGQAVSRTTYATLYALWGPAGQNICGAGDGSTTFDLPSMVDRVPVGDGASTAIADLLGAATHTHAVHSDHAAHLHAVGTLDAAAESTHTHGVGSYDAAAEASHTHDVNHPEALFTSSQETPQTGTNNLSGGGSAARADKQHTHTVSVDLPNRTSTAGTSHDHALSGTSAAGSSHDHALSGSTANSAAESHSAHDSPSNLQPSFVVNFMVRAL